MCAHLNYVYYPACADWLGDYARKVHWIRSSSTRHRSLFIQNVRGIREIRPSDTIVSGRSPSWTGKNTQRKKKNKSNLWRNLWRKSICRIAARKSKSNAKSNIKKMKCQRSIILGFIQTVLWYVRNDDIRGTSDISIIEDEIERLCRNTNDQTNRSTENNYIYLPRRLKRKYPIDLLGFNH